MTLSRPRIRLSPQVAIGVAAALVFGMILASPANATPTWENDCDVALDSAVCERVQYLAEQSDALNGAVAAIAAEQARENALVDTARGGQKDRADLAWWGIWGLVGLTFVSLIAERWFRAWSIEGKIN